jgi:DNA helicase HerA-like ATPase
MSLLNLYLGEYKDEPIRVFGGGFDKVNLITGMKGGGKSHIAKGLISENRKANMSAVVFDINGEYDTIPDSMVLHPGKNLKFRLDYLEVSTLFEMFARLAPLPEKTMYSAYAKLPEQIRSRIDAAGSVDLNYLMTDASMKDIIKNDSEISRNMRDAYRRSLDILNQYNIFMTEQEALLEDSSIRAKSSGHPKVIGSMSSFAVEK